MIFFKKVQKVGKYLYYFSKIICCQDLSVVAQSGRTHAAYWEVSLTGIQLDWFRISKLLHKINNIFLVCANPIKSKGGGTSCTLTSPIKALHTNCSNRRIPQWMVECCRKMENFQSLHWHSLLWNPQTVAASVNEPKSLDYLKLAADFLPPAGFHFWRESSFPRLLFQRQTSWWSVQSWRSNDGRCLSWNRQIGVYSLSPVYMTFSHYANWFYEYDKIFFRDQMVYTNAKMSRFVAVIMNLYWVGRVGSLVLPTLEY